MLILERYILRVFFAKLAMTLIGLGFGLLIFDILANADDVIGGGRVLLPLVYYGALRLPQHLTLLTPLGVLLATLFTVITLLRHSEIVAMRAFGFTVYRIAAPMLVGAAIVGVAHFWLADQVLTKTTRMLRDWRAQDYVGLPVGGSRADEVRWVAEPGAIVHAGSARDQGRTLLDVTLVRLADDGRMRDYVRADFAIWENGRWTLGNVDRVDAAGARDTGLNELVLDLPFTPSRFATISALPEELSLRKLVRIFAVTGGNRPDYFYKLWFQRKFALSLSTLIMVLIAAPMALHLTRQRGLLWGVSGAVAAGALYFFVDRLVLVLGEGGLLPPVLVAWTPLVLFGSAAGWFLLQMEG